MTIHSEYYKKRNWLIAEYRKHQHDYEVTNISYYDPGFPPLPFYWSKWKREWNDMLKVRHGFIKVPEWKRSEINNILEGKHK